LVVASSAAAAIALIPLYRLLVASAAAAAMALVRCICFVLASFAAFAQLRLLFVVASACCCRYCIDPAASALYHFALPLAH
jgi:hypothetical protein